MTFLANCVPKKRNLGEHIPLSQVILYYMLVKEIAEDVAMSSQKEELKERLNMNYHTQRAFAGDLLVHVKDA